MAGNRRDFTIGVDVGGSKVAVMVVDGHRRIQACLQAPTDLRTPQATFDGILQVIREGMRQSGVGPQQVAAVGVGVPGRVNPSTGVVRLAVNLNWIEYSLAESLRQALGVPCQIENDVRAAALGLHRYGLDASVDNLAYLNIGTGVSAGLILNGQLFTGSRGMAGEVGHIIVDPCGPRCACGLNGCLETMVSGPALARFGQKIAGSLPGVQGPVTAEMVLQAAAAGFTPAVEIVRTASRCMAWAIHGLVMAYDVERVFLGGGVTRSGEAFFNPIMKEVENLRAVSPLAAEMMTPGLIQRLPEGFSAGLWGAIAVAERSTTEAADGR